MQELRKCTAAAAVEGLEAGVVTEVVEVVDAVDELSKACRDAANANRYAFLRKVGVLGWIRGLDANRTGVGVRLPIDLSIRR